MARGVGTGGSLTVHQQLLLLAIHLVLFFFGCVVGDIIHHVHTELQQDTPCSSPKKGISDITEGMEIQQVFRHKQ